MIKAKGAGGKSRASRKNGRPPHQPSDHLRNVVRYLVVGYGERQADIAKHLGVAPHTLRKHYRTELDQAKGDIDAAAIQTLVLKMLGGPKREWDKSDTACLLFYCKTRLGFREAPQELHHTGMIGTYDYSKLTDEQLETLDALLTAAAGPGGAAGRDTTPQD